MYSIDYLYQIFGGFENFLYFCAPKRRGARVVEEARLESVYTPKGYPGFESPSLRWKELQNEEEVVSKRWHNLIYILSSA